MLLFIFACLIGVSQAHDVVTSLSNKEPLYLKEGSVDVTIPCRLNQRLSPSDYEMSWTSYHEGIRYISRESEVTDEDHFELLTSEPGQYDLKIKLAEREFVEGSYQCTAFDKSRKKQFSTDSAKIVWLVPPGDPRITNAPREPLMEGSSALFTCVSEGGSPPPTFSWTLPNGTTVSEMYSKTENNVTESVLKLFVTYDFNDKNVMCAVTNKATEGMSDKTTEAELNVLFKPRVEVGPVSNYSVEEGQVIELTCRGRGNPSLLSYEWTRDNSSERYISANWPFEASRGMSGKYTCSVTNSAGKGTDYLNLDVQYAPIVTVEKHVSADQGNHVEIICQVDANPPATRINWIGPGGGVISDGPRLILKDVKRDQSGNYTCTATNFLMIYDKSGSQERNGSGISLLDIKRPPGKAVIEAVDEKRQSFVVDEDIELQCYSPDPGSPVAQYMWNWPDASRQPKIINTTKSVLIIERAQLADNGRYKCTPFNHLGKGEMAVMDVTVIQAATISPRLATERVFNSGDPVTDFRCEAHGYPAPHIHWYKDGVLLEGQSYRMETTILGCSNTYCAQTVQSQLNFTSRIQWADKGNYTCEARNTNLVPSAKTWCVVHVVHGPVILNERFPTNALASADPGSRGELKCRISARPDPKVVWSFKGQEVDDGGRYSTSMTQLDSRPDEFEHVLAIENVNENDYGEYMCTVHNGAKSSDSSKASIILELRKTTKPQSPTDLRKVTATENSIVLGWRAGFDGGYEQTYTIEYSKVNPFTEQGDKGEVVTVEVRKPTASQEIKNDGSPAYLYKFNVTNLRPLSTYNFRIRSSNRKGKSEFSEIVNAQTDDVLVDSQMIAPVRLQFDLTKRAIEVEPATSADKCTMLYVATSGSDLGTWRAVDCYPANKPITVAPGVSAYKARFCPLMISEKSMDLRLKCSPLSEIFDSGPMRSEWRPYLIISFVLVAAILIAIVLIVCCCLRGRSPKKAKRRPVITTMPQIEAKNTIVHGSNADSGVFTLDSGRPKDAHQTYSSEEAPKAWSPDAYELNRDGFSTEQPVHAYHGIQEDQDQESSISEPDEEDGRRVMREIIV